MLHIKLIFITMLLFKTVANMTFAQQPQVIATEPAQNAVHISTSSKITATFNIDIDESTISDATVIVHANQSGMKRGTLSYYSGSRTVTFIPNEDFKSGEIVSVILTNEIIASNGMSLENGFSWDFTIRTKQSSLDYIPADQYYAGIFPCCLYAGDFNQDSDIDLSIAESGAPGNLYIYSNNGKAKFVLTRTYSGVYYPTHMTGIDLDSDGDIDLITSNHDSDNSGFVCVWLNKGDTSFELIDYYGYAKDFGHSWICSHDFDGDGDHDLAAAIGMADKVSILFNNGDATFASPVLHDVGDWPHSLVSADFDLDGDMDLAVANRGSHNVSILINASGQYTLVENYPVGNSPYSISTADFDRDGYADLAVTNMGSNNVSVLLNHGDGSFAAANYYSVLPQPRRMMAADFDGDSDIDLAAIIYSFNTVQLLCNNGNGEFTDGGSFPVGKYPDAIQIADLDSDGDLDIIIVNGNYPGNVSIFLNKEIGTKPKILDIKDVGNDQGRQVRIVWKHSLYDAFDSDTSVTFYSLWRRVDDFRGQTNYRHYLGDYTASAFANGKLFQINERAQLQQQSNGVLWDFIANISAERHDQYAFVAPTLADSTSEGIYWSVFYVSAHTQNPDVFFCSAPDSGYSVDNLAPNAPEGLIAERQYSIIKLSWNRNLEDDFKYYAIYRSHQRGFNPDTTKVFATTIDTTFSDHDMESTLTYCYRISAFDFSGNRSEYSGEVCVLPTKVKEIQEGIFPIKYSLSQNYPNPFNPTTTIHYGIPSSVYVTLTIYDINGREIITLVKEQHASGWYKVQWDGLDKQGQLVSTGTYLVQLKAGDFVTANKIVLIK